jgi:hypothetical protein
VERDWADDPHGSHKIDLVKIKIKFGGHFILWIFNSQNVIKDRGLCLFNSLWDKESPRKATRKL